MFYVQHLLGIGHLRRAGYIAGELAIAGLDVHLVSGGMPVPDIQLPGVAWRQLPPVRSLDGHFDKLVDANGGVIDEPWKVRRRDALLAIFRNLQPDALITETYPFGRRMLRFELIPLLDAAAMRRVQPLRISSIRDILQPKSTPGRDEETRDIIMRHYDRILVHGDCQAAELSDTFPFSEMCKDITHYTGYIAPPNDLAEQSADAGREEILISGGGGAASLNLLKTALAARPLSQHRTRDWRVLVGDGLNDSVFYKLKNSAGEGVFVERNRSDFQQLLANCCVSVSQAGYNTAVDILRSGARAVLVPFSQGSEIEQTLRARLLEERGIAITISEDSLTPQTLADAINRAATMRVPPIEFAMDGARSSARLIKAWLDER